jgi:tetratricopeptide (TPR) repeat protein
MGLFYLATLYGFVRATDSSRAGDDRLWLWLSWLTCLFGMATKEVMVTAPVIVLLYDRTFVAGTFGEAWRRRRGYYAGLAGTWLVLAALVASTGGDRGGTAGFSVAVSGGAYFLTQFEAVAHYLRLSLWPHPLVFDYGTFRVRGAEVLPRALLVLLFLAAALWGLLRPASGHRGARAAGFLGAWFFVILAPTSLTPGMLQIIVEHRMYLPLAAVLAAAVLGMDALAAKLGLSVAVRLAAVLAAALALGGLTCRRNETYHTAAGLWGDTVAKRPRNAVAIYNLGVSFDQVGRLPEAAEQFVRVAQLRPDLAAPHYDLGFALFQMGRPDEAVTQYQESLRLDPSSALARNSLGVALASLGRLDEALGQYAEAIKLSPGYAQAHDNWGNALLQQGRLPAAAAEYAAAVRLDPDSAIAHYNLANAFLRLGRPAEAAAQLAEVLRLRPGDPAVREALAQARQAAGENQPR